MHCNRALYFNIIDVLSRRISLFEVDLDSFKDGGSKPEVVDLYIAAYIIST